MERSFGDLQGGKNTGKQINVGYDSHATNFRLSRKTNESSKLTFGIQRSFMDDVPRTHKRVDGLTWEGCPQVRSVGGDLIRRETFITGSFPAKIQSVLPIRVLLF